MILLPLCSASLTHKNSQGSRKIDGLHWDTTIIIDGQQLLLMDLKNVFEECPVCMIWNRCWKLATSKQKSNFIHSYNKLRIISERIDGNIATQFFLLKAATVTTLSLPYMESMWLNQDGGQWLVIQQSFLLTDCIKP